MKKVIILSGVSGSGKSTYIANELHTHKYSYEIVSADNYFYTYNKDSDNLSGIEKPEYFFDYKKLADAHAACFNKFFAAMQRVHTELIFVDNTNTTEIEIAPYILGAQAFGYEAEIRTIWSTNMEKYLELFAERNKHGVTLKSIKNQYRNILNSHFPMWWKQVDIAPII